MREATAHQDRTDELQALLKAGIAAYRSGDAAGAAQAFGAALEIAPCHYGAHVNLANALWSQGKLDDAERAADRACAIEPKAAEARIIKGAIRLDRGDASGALCAYDEAVTLRPDLANAQAGLAAALLASGRSAEAAQAAERALAIEPMHAHALFTLGSARAAGGDPAGALQALDRVVRMQPGSARAHLNRGNALIRLDRIEEGRGELIRAATLDPMAKEAWASLGALLTITGELGDAIEACARAIAIDKDYAEAHWNQGVAQLLAGDLRSGFAAYEWRKRHPSYRHQFAPLPAPEWRGEALDGKHLFVRAEQGLGDTVMLSRFFPELARRAAKLTLACPPTLFPLFSDWNIALCPLAATVPDIDLAADQMSLPHLLAVTTENIPGTDGYMRADPARAKRFASLFTGPRGRARIGLVWAGNPHHSNDSRRSLPRGALAPLLAQAGIDFFALQLGARCDEYDIASLAPHIGDFGDTAALLAHLDGVVTVDTSVAHLAGALGVPCHMLISMACDWRWLLGRDTTPWYRSLRLHRQERLGDWSAPIASALAALAPLAAGALRGRASDEMS